MQKITYNLNTVWNTVNKTFDKTSPISKSQGSLWKRDKKDGKIYYIKLLAVILYPLEIPVITLTKLIFKIVRKLKNADSKRQPILERKKSFGYPTKNHQP